MKMRKFRLTSKNGFSLVEMLVALFIIALVILGGGMFFFQSRVYTLREAHRRAAVLVASGKLEELKATNYDDIGSTTEEVDVDNLSKDSTPAPTMITVVEYVPDGDNPEAYKKVKVTVSWSDRPSDTVSLTTLIAPR